MCTDLYNSEEFNPFTTAYPNLHNNFANPIRILKEERQNVTPEKIKEKIYCFQTRVAMLVAAYHKSGNGDSHEIDDTNDLNLVIF